MEFSAPPAMSTYNTKEKEHAQSGLNYFIHDMHTFIILTARDLPYEREVVLTVGSLPIGR